MNKFKKVNFAIIVAFLIVIMSCGKDSTTTFKPDEPDKPECVATDKLETTNIPGSDNQLGSPHQGQIVLQFSLEQEYKTYSNNCKPAEYGNTSLKIKNITNQKIQFGFLLRFQRGVVSWQYASDAIIEPGQVIDLGKVYDGPVKVNGGTIAISPTSPIVYL